MKYDTRLVFYGRKVIDTGRPVVSYLDTSAWDGHNPMRLPPDVRPSEPKRTYTPYRGMGNIGPNAMRGRVYMMVIHHDACLSARQCFKVLVRRGLSTHFIIDNDGIIYQPWDLAHSTWHAGKVNRYAVGFDMSNAASIQYASHYRDRGIFTGEINGGKFTALGYSEAQYLSAIGAIKAICRFFPRIKPVPPIGEDGQVINKVIANDRFEGVLGHYHLSVHKWDPGPGFDWKRVFNAVHGGGFAFPLSLGYGGGTSDVLQTAAERTAARFYANNESYPGGGWYPIGLNGTWHSGVHLHGEEGQRVNNVFDGKIIAARFTENASLGSPNFVLIQHLLREGKEEKTFYSLYMHLDPVHWNAPRIPWLLEAKAKAGKKPKDTGDASAWDDIDAGEGDVDPATLRPSFGKNYWALTEGKVAVFDPPIEIQSNMLVGYMGLYGPEDEASAQIDFAIFSGEQIIDLEKFQKDWEVLDPDEDENAICDITEVVKRVDPKFSKFQGRAYVSSEELARFFASNPDRAEMRAYICKHISEWWTGTSWKEALQRRNVWAWDTQRKLKVLERRIAPFQWYNEDLAKELGLPDDGLVWTYHPIRFLLWLKLTQGGSKLIVGERQRGLTAKEMEAARQVALDAHEDGNWLQLSETGEDPDDFLSDWDDMFGEWDEEVSEEWRNSQGPGEWAPDTDIFDTWGD